MIRCAILVVATDTEPLSDAVAESVGLLGQNLPAIYFLEERRVASDRHFIAEILRGWCDEEEISLVLTIGGTFPPPVIAQSRSHPKPQADVIERAMPSLPEAMRAYAARTRSARPGRSRHSDTHFARQFARN